MEATHKETTLPPIVDQIKEYAETRIKLAKYEAIEGASSAIASILAAVAIGICLLMAVLFASFTLGYYLTDVFGAAWKGFGCVTVLYILIAFIVKANKDNIEKPIIQAFISKLFK